MVRRKLSVTYFAHHLEHFLLVRLHVSESSNLSKIYVLSIAESDNLIKSKQELESVIVDFLLLDRLAVLRDLEFRLELS